MCSYEADIVVTLEVTDVLDGGTIVHGPTNQLMFDVSSTSNVTLSCYSTYNVVLVVEDQVSDKITIQTVYSELVQQCTLLTLFTLQVVMATRSSSAIQSIPATTTILGQVMTTTSRVVTTVLITTPTPTTTGEPHSHLKQYGLHQCDLIAVFCTDISTTVLTATITTGLLLLLVILFVVITSIVCAAVIARRKRHKGIIQQCTHAGSSFYKYRSSRY